MTELRDLGVLLTRAADDTEAWAERIRDRGGRPVIFPCVRFADVVDADTVSRLRVAVGAADWVVFTSRRGVQATSRLLGAGPPASARVAAVGPATAREARRLLGRNDLVGDGGAEALGRRLSEVLAATGPTGRPARVVAPAADRAGRDLEAVLGPLDVELTRIAVYRTVSLGPGDGPGIDLGQSGVDVVVLASPSAVAGLVSRTTVPERVKVITIGPTTTRAARAAGLVVSAEAHRPDLEGLLEAIP